MKIALIGYGRMGQVVEEIATQRGHEITLHAGHNGFEDASLREADVAIEFTRPEVAFENIRRCIENRLPVVSGTTGWLDKKPEIDALCRAQKGSFLYASNFSLGVNITFALNRQLAALMADRDYDPSILEIHHTGKKDAPSGTAITLAEDIIGRRLKLKQWKLENGSDALESDLVIRALREDPTPGTHTVRWHSEIDDIEITHTAHNRNGFGLGAVLAAEYLIENPGIRTMEDVLGLPKT